MGKHPVFNAFKKVVSLFFKAPEINVEGEYDQNQKPWQEVFRRSDSQAKRSWTDADGRRTRSADGHARYARLLL